MASVKGGNNLIPKAQQAVETAKQQNTLGVYIGLKSTQERFEKMLGKKAPAFLQSLLTMSNNNKALQKCTPATVLSAAAIAASLDLPVNPALGFAWIIPYGSTATFQLGYKGLVQMFMRSNVAKSVVATEVYRGEIKDFNRFTETYIAGERESDEVVGYFASFELINGFRKSVYWTKDEVIRHAKKFSKSYSSGPWQTNFDQMAIKTVLSSLLRTYAPLNTVMQEAVEADGKAGNITENGSVEYVDVEAGVIGEEDLAPEPILEAEQE